MRNPQDIKIGNLTLEEIIKNHQHWIIKDCEGWESMRANLHNANLAGADLHGTNLSGADLYCANLVGTDLRSAGLYCADLHNANLMGANLTDAYLQGADLYCAYLVGADLRNADLRNANLCGTDLYGADLCNADLYGANLGSANLLGADGRYLEYRKGKILTENLIGYKKCKDNAIVTLEIPRGAIVFSINGNRYRTNKAKVIDIEGADRAYSSYKYMSYYVGDEINIYDFNCEYNIDCAEGIHFYITKEEVKNY